MEEVSPFAANMVLGYTNGLESYVGTERDYLLGKRGGYETSPRGAAFMMRARLPLRADAEARIRKGIVRALRDLRAA